MNSYGPTDPSKDDEHQALAIGQSWVDVQASISQAYVPRSMGHLRTTETRADHHLDHSTGKPTFAAAFGIVTQENLPFFVPVNGTESLGRSESSSGNVHNSVPL
jgi:hypothetical protein